MNNKQSSSFGARLIGFTTIIIITILFVVPAFLASLLKMIPDSDQPGYGSKGTALIYKDRDFTQYFVAKSDDFAAIGTTIKNPNLKNKKDIIFKLFDENENLVRTVVINGFNIGDGDFVKIMFEPIPDSMNKKYSFNVSTPEAGDEERIELFLTEPTNQVLNYYYDEEMHKGGAPIVTYHKPVSKFETIRLIFINLFSKL